VLAWCGVIDPTSQSQSKSVLFPLWKESLSITRL